MQIWDLVKIKQTKKSQTKEPKPSLTEVLQNPNSVPIFHIVYGRKLILASHLLKQSQNRFR